MNRNVGEGRGEPAQSKARRRLHVGGGFRRGEVDRRPRCSAGCSALSVLHFECCIWRVSITPGMVLRPAPGGRATPGEGGLQQRAWGMGSCAAVSWQPPTPRGATRWRASPRRCTCARTSAAHTAGLPPAPARSRGPARQPGRRATCTRRGTSDRGVRLSRAGVVEDRRARCRASAEGGDWLAAAWPASPPGSPLKPSSCCFPAPHATAAP